MNKRLLAVAAVLVLSVIVFSTCVHKGEDGGDVRGAAYAGSAACLKCHKNVCDSFFHTAHALTSRPADISSVKGSFVPPNNVYSYGPGMDVVMERRDSGLYQVATIEGRKVAHRFDITIGSGRKAQTYLTWAGDTAKQLPVSYLVYTNSWANSPSFPEHLIWFNRMIPVRCFECHSSYIQKKPTIRIDAFHALDQFDRTKVVYGIDCERCHGPGAEHAAYQEAYPADKQARYIRSYASLNRLQRMDLCGVCHSGSHEMSKSAFRFKPGDTLSNFYYAESHVIQKPSAMDVHGNQYQLLIGSKCYLKSSTLVCTSCHAPHAMERDNLAAFSQRCIDRKSVV